MLEGAAQGTPILPFPDNVMPGGEPTGSPLGFVLPTISGHPMRIMLILCASILFGCSKAADVKPVAPGREGSDWPKFLGPTGDNVSTEKNIRTAWPREGLPKVWECKLGRGYAPPAVADGKLYHFDAFETTARLTCRNALNGELVWNYDYEFKYEDLYGYDDGPRCGPVVDGDRIYTYGVEGLLNCISNAGKLVWSFDTRAEYHFHQNFFGVGSSPVIEGDSIIVAVGGSAKGPRPSDLRDAKPNGTGIVAIDKKTGKVRYAALDELASYSSPTVVTLHGQRVGLYFARAGLVGFDPATGKQHFRYPWRSKDLESVNASNPMVVGDTIVISESYRVGTACLKVKSDLSGVTEVWTDAGKDREVRALATHWNTPIHDGGYFYASDGRHDSEGDLRCIELATGNRMWREKRTTRCSLIKVDGHMLSLGENGDLRLFKIDSKKFDEVAKWESPDLASPCWAPPVLSHGLLYVRGKGKLVCYDLAK